MTRQYVQIQLKPNGKLYTYINDQPDDVQIGHSVEVTTPFGGTPLVAEVKEVTFDRPDSIPDHVQFKPCTKV